MFHVLTEKAAPDTLFSGYTSSLIKGVWMPIQSDSNSVQCGATVGQRREAISYTRFVKYENEGKLRIKHLCKACGKKLKVKYHGET